MSQQINLYNPIFLKQKQYFSVTTMVQALGLILVGTACFYGYAYYQIGQLSKKTEELNQQYVTEQTKLSQYSQKFAVGQSAQVLENEVKQLESQAAAQDATLQLLKGGAIGNTDGYSEFMRAFARQSVKGLWLTGFDIIGDGAQISMTGGVTNPRLVPEYIQRLGREKVMHGKTIETLRMQQPEKDGDRAVPRYVEFRLSSVLSGSEAKK